MTNTAWDQPSSYFESLTNTDKADYKRKLTLSTGELLSDTFTMKNSNLMNPYFQIFLGPTDIIT